MICPSGIQWVKDWNRKKNSFESVKGVSTFIVKIPFIARASKTGKRDDYIGVVVNKAMIEIGETEKTSECH